MDDRRRTLVAVALIVGVLVIVAVFAGTMMTRTSIVSPLPQESAIKIIFNTPTVFPDQNTTSAVFPKTATPSAGVPSAP